MLQSAARQRKEPVTGGQSTHGKGTKLTFSQMAGAALSGGNAVDIRRPRFDLAAVLRQRPGLLSAADSTRPVADFRNRDLSAPKRTNASPKRSAKHRIPVIS